MKFMLALAALALAAPALAEAPSALPSRIAGFSPCILECLKHNEGPDGCTIGDVECSCTKPQYSSGVTMCVLNQGCSAADIEAASKVHQEDCAPYAARAVPSAISSGVASLPSGLPSCISKCLDISKGCEPGEVECSCNNPLYAHNVETCFSNCTSAERHIADKQHSSLCAPYSTLPTPSTTGPVGARDIGSSLTSVASSVLSSITSAASSVISSLSSESAESSESSAISSFSSRVPSATSVAGSVLSSLSSVAASVTNTSPNAAQKAWTGMGAGAWGTVAVAVAGVLVGGALVV